MKPKAEGGRVVNSVPGRDPEAGESLSLLDCQPCQSPVSPSTEAPAWSCKQRGFRDLFPLGSRPLHGRKRISNLSCDCPIPHPDLNSLTVSSHLTLLTRNLRPREGICLLSRKRKRKRWAWHGGRDIAKPGPLTPVP